MRKLILGLAAVAAIATPLAAATVANASVNIDSNGTGFIGKGDVQTAFSWNNAKMQTNHTKITFSGEQATSQSLTQSVSQAGYRVGAQQGTQHATQTATQAATQVVGQDLTCEFTNGNGTVTFHRDGVRDGERTGTREGTREGERPATRLFERFGERTGTQAGTQTGSLASVLDVTDRKTGQYTGWNVKGFVGTPTYSEVGNPTFGGPTFGDYVFGDPQYRDWLFLGDFIFGDFTATSDYTFEDGSGTEWGEWDAESGENPADCLRSQNADKITQISNVITPGAITDGVVTGGTTAIGGTTQGAIIGEYDVPQPIKHGAITAGDVTNVGAIKVSATFNGITKAIN